METTIEYDGLKWSRKPSGYYQSTTRCTDGSRKNWYHQYVYEKSAGKIPEGYEVHHKDEDKQNNNFENLELLSSAEHQAEHKEQNKANAYKDSLKERETENYSLFRKIDFNLSPQNYAGKNGNSIPMNIVQEQAVFSQRKR